MKTETRNLARQQRAASIQPATFNREARTVEVVWTTGAKVRRFDFWNDREYEEELVVDASAIDLNRLNSGAAPVLDSHRSYGLDSQIGVIERAWIDGNEGRALLRLSGREELAGLVADIEAGIIRNISVGYAVRKYEITKPGDRSDGVGIALYRAVDWEPYELSFVTIPADAASSTRDHSSTAPCEFIYRGQAPNKEAHNMDKQDKPADDTQAANPAAPAEDTTAVATRAEAAAVARAGEIAELATRHGFGAEAVGWIKENKTVDQVRGIILEKMATRSEKGGHPLNVRTITDETETRLQGMAGAILHRIKPSEKLDDNSKQYRGMSLIELGRDFLESNGVHTRGLDRRELAGRILHFRSGNGMSSSDFPSLMANVANKRLRAAYDENPGTYAMWARRAPNAPDFKNVQVTVLSGAPELLAVNEHGEYKYGAMSDGKETYAVTTYGRIVNLTRQAIINDDLRGFDRLIASFGFSARRLENATVYAQLTSNPTMADTGALFNATAVTTAGGHANLASGGGSVLQASSLVTGRTAMRVQKGLQSEILNIAPAYLIVPAALEQTAYQLTSNQYTPATKAEINEFRQGGRTSLEPIVEPLLDATSATAWYLAASNSQIDTVEYCYLEGSEGVFIESEMGFETDGVSYKCRLDFAAKAIDYRGLYKSAGA